MTPRDEILATGRLGDLGADLLYRTVFAVGVGYAFPPPEGWAIWGRDAAVEAAHNFLENGRTPRRLMDIALRSVDDASFAGQLDTAVLNWLRDDGRRTDLGKLMLRVKEILRSSDSFVHVGGPDDRWSLPGAADAGATETSVLASAIAHLPVTVPRWTSSRRDAPLADRPSFEVLIVAVLTAAGGSVPVREIAGVLATRLDHRRVPLAVSLDALDGAGEPADVGADPADHTAAEVHATAIFNQLSDRERLLVPHLEQSVREIASRIGTGKSQAALVRQRLVDRLRGELLDDSAEEAGDTMGVLCDLCGAWARRWTGTQGCDVPVEHEEKGEG